MKLEQILKNIRAELNDSVDAKTKSSFQRFFKEPVKAYGVKTGTVSMIARKYWPEIRSFDKKEIFALCEELLKSDHMEEAFIVAEWCPRLKDKFEKSDLKIFRRWIDSYINNWAKCDSFCNHTMGDFIEKYPETIDALKIWTNSKNRWMRRASAVSLIVPAKHGKFLTHVFEIADMLLEDKDDMVQKGYGWMLKEASRMHQKEVFNYVVKNKKKMPRTALRYAIELMPQELRMKAMDKSRA